MVAVQKGAPKIMKDHFKRIKLMKNNYANKPTDKELFFIKRAYKSNNTFGKFPLEVKTHNIKRNNLDKWKGFISWQNFN